MLAPHLGGHRPVARVAEAAHTSIAVVGGPVEPAKPPSAHNVAGDPERGPDLHAITWPPVTATSTPVENITSLAQEVRLPSRPRRPGAPAV